jgi:CubicO group peptidase (beta-lactamase class C family)
MNRISTIVVVLVLLLAGTVSAQPGISDALDAYLQDQMGPQRLPGLAFVLVDADGTAQTASYGEARAGEPVTSDTRFAIASMTKAFTAAAVLQLVEEGLVDLDAPIQTYLPNFTTQQPDLAAQITVRHLLNQTSGLSDAGFNSLAAPPQDTLAAGVALLQDATHFAPPGTAFAYFNPNYDLAGRIIEVVSGQSYAAYMEEHIFTPLGMLHTAAYDDFARAREDGMAQGHILPFGVAVAWQENINLYGPAGGIVSTARDLGAFLAQFTTGESPILGGESLDLMLTTPRGIDSPYGMGWFVTTIPDGIAVYQHGGDIHSFHSDMVILRDEGTAYALLYNRQHFLSAFTSFPQIMNGVASILTGAQPAGGISAATIGIILGIIALISITSDSLRLLRSGVWARRTADYTVGRRMLGLISPFVPLAILLLLPSLSLLIMQRAVDYETLLAYLPDVIGPLLFGAAIGTLTAVVRMVVIARGAARGPRSG